MKSYLQFLLFLGRWATPENFIWNTIDQVASEHLLHEEPQQSWTQRFCFQLLLLTQPILLYGTCDFISPLHTGFRLPVVFMMGQNFIGLRPPLDDSTQHIQCKKQFVLKYLIRSETSRNKKFWLALSTSVWDSLASGKQHLKRTISFPSTKNFPFYFCKRAVTCHKQWSKSMHCFLLDINSTPDFLILILQALELPVETHSPQLHIHKQFFAFHCLLQAESAWKPKSL